MSVEKGHDFKKQGLELGILQHQIEIQQAQELGLLVELVPLPRLDRNQEKSPYQYNGDVTTYFAGEFGDGGE